MPSMFQAGCETMKDKKSVVNETFPEVDRVKKMPR